MTTSRSTILLITLLTLTININSQDCDVTYYSPDTIPNHSLSVCIDVTIRNSLDCIRKTSKISKFAFRRFNDKDFFAVPNSPFQVEIYDSLGRLIQPLDDRLYVDLKGYHDYYILDTSLITSSFKIGILTNAYRLEPYKTYKAKLMLVLENNKQPYIHSSYTFYITELPYQNRFRLFKRKLNYPCFTIKNKSIR